MYEIKVKINRQSSDYTPFSDCIWIHSIEILYFIEIVMIYPKFYLISEFTSLSHFSVASNFPSAH